MQELPIYEPGLDDVVKEARDRNLFFSTDTHKHVAEGDIIFVRYCLLLPLSLLLPLPATGGCGGHGTLMTRDQRACSLRLFVDSHPKADSCHGVLS